MSALVNGFEAFKIFTSISLHFRTRDYFYNRKNKIPVKFETYYSSKSYEVFEYNLSKYEEDDLEHLIVANFIHCANLQPNILKNNMAERIRDKWFQTLENIDDIFVSELLNLMNEFNINAPLELFELIKTNTEVQVCSDVVRVDSILEVMDDELPINNYKNNAFFVELSKRDYHFLLVIDEIMKRYWNYSFLDDFVLKNTTIKTHRLIFCRKYKRLLNLDDMLAKPKIKKFISCL